MSWFELIFRPRRLDDDLAEELQEHIEERTEQIMRLENLSRPEARQAALRAFGNPTLVRTRSREVWQWSRLESLVADLKLALRRLRKSPGFGITILLTLAIGIGANTAVFTVVDGILLKPLPYPQPEQLVAVWLHAPGAAGLANFAEGLRLSPSMYFTFAEHSRTFQSIGVWISGTANVTGIAQPEEVHTTYISDGVLQTLYVMPEFWSRGVGSTLHDHALDRLCELQVEEARLWTLTENHRGRAFYEKRGWSLTGRTRVVPFPPYPIDVEYARSTRRRRR